MSDSMSGRVLGNFEIIDEIGRGGMGVVYRTRQLSLDRVVALKTLPASIVRDDTAAERFTREAHAMAKLSHPNIVDVIEVGEEDGVSYFAMQYIDGPSLAELMTRQEDIELERAAEIAAQIADGLAHAHERAVVHRDIKPGNVLIAPDGRAIVTDFGIAKAMEGLTLAGGHSLTQGSIGTPEYMSPEVIRGNPVDGRSDIYSLGIVLYQMVTGRVPFTAITPFEIANRHLSEPPTPPASMGCSCPHWMESILMRALAKQPAERFSSAAEMATALRERAAVPLPNAPSPPADTAHSENYLRVLNEGLTRWWAAHGIELPGHVRALAGTGAALLLIALLWIVGRSMLSAIAPPSSPPSPVNVPGITGLSFEEARELLATERLTAVRFRNEHNDTVPTERVIEQDPAAGTSTDPYTRVNLTVSLGPHQREVIPDVIGLPRREAVTALANAGLSPEVAGEEYSAHHEAGCVVAQTPAAHSVAPLGSAVALAVSLGPEPGAALTDLETYTSARNGFRLDIPRDWDIVESTYGDGATYYRTEFICPDTDVMALVDCGPPGTSPDPLDSWRDSDQRFKQVYKENYNCISLRHTTLSGQPAGYWEFVLTRDGRRYRKIDVGANIGGRGFAVLVQAPPEQFEEYRNLFMAMIESFEVL